jgi:pyridoxamine 5'-phosphate oxidase
MSATKPTFWTETLPNPLPPNPVQIAVEWLAQARLDAAQPNPNAMVLATVDGRGQPSARVVLCKEIDADAGFINFYTNYQSRKGRDLEGNPRAAIVFHWDHRHRQIRAEGRVERLSDAQNDAYFRSRAWQSRLGAWASQQSEPVESRQALADAVAAAAHRFDIPYDGPGSPEPDAVRTDIPRPWHWGGLRLRVEAIELWVEGEFRIHDRARWTRVPPAARDGGPTVADGGDIGTGAGGEPRAATAVEWSVTRLQP